MFRNSAALFLLGGTITHRPKDKATENALHSIVALLPLARTTTKWRAKNPLARCERTDTTPTQLRSDTALSQTKGRKADV